MCEKWFCLQYYNLPIYIKTDNGQQLIKLRPTKTIYLKLDLSNKLVLRSLNLFVRVQFLMLNTLIFTKVIIHIIIFRIKPVHNECL